MPVGGLKSWETSSILRSYVPISIISATDTDTDICTEYYCSVLRDLGDKKIFRLLFAAATAKCHVFYSHFKNPINPFSCEDP